MRPGRHLPKQHMPICMPGPGVRLDRQNHEELQEVAADLETTVGEAIAIATRRLRQQRNGRDQSTNVGLANSLHPGSARPDSRYSTDSCTRFGTEWSVGDRMDRPHSNDVLHVAP
jgi:hypothetical protein